MTEQKKNVNVTVKLTLNKKGYRAAFPHIFEPWSQDQNESDLLKKKYQIMICLDKETDQEAIKQVNDAAKEVVEKFWGKAAVKKLGVSIDSPLVDGAKKDKYENLQFYQTISTKLSGYRKIGDNYVKQKPPKMAAIVDGKLRTPEHTDWSEDMMMTGRYGYIISLYTSSNVNKQGNKVCASLESIIALPPVEGDEEEVLPGFGGTRTAVEDDFADLFKDLGVELPGDEFNDSDDEFNDSDDELDEDLDEDLDAELDSEDDPEPEPAPKKRRGRPAKAESKTEDKSTVARERTRRARTSVE